MKWLLRFLIWTGLVQMHINCDQPGCPTRRRIDWYDVPSGWTENAGQHYCPDHRLRLMIEGR